MSEPVFQAVSVQEGHALWAASHDQENVVEAPDWSHALAGKVVFRVSSDGLVYMANQLRQGAQFPPLILVRKMSMRILWSWRDMCG